MSADIMCVCGMRARARARVCVCVRGEYTHAGISAEGVLQQAGELRVAVRHVQRARPIAAAVLVSEGRDDVAEGEQAPIDVDALLEPLIARGGDRRLEKEGNSETRVQGKVEGSGSRSSDRRPSVPLALH
jgi:hypothetical protein